MKTYSNNQSGLIAGIFIGFSIGILTLLGILTASGATAIQITTKWERDAIMRGYAEYVVDVETKVVKFVWKEKP